MFFCFCKYKENFFVVYLPNQSFIEFFMNQERFVFRKPTLNEVDNVVEIINCAIKRLCNAGISQWQNGYPNKEVVLQDIANGVGRVLCKEEKILLPKTVICILTLQIFHKRRDMNGKYL